jgi:hypothetical protein
MSAVAQRECLEAMTAGMVAVEQPPEQSVATVHEPVARPRDDAARMIDGCDCPVTGTMKTEAIMCLRRSRHCHESGDRNGHRK